MLIEEQLRERLKAKLEEACRRDFAKDKIGILQQAPFSRKLTPVPEAPARIAVTVVSVRHPAPPRGQVASRTGDLDGHGTGRPRHRSLA